MLSPCNRGCTAPQRLPSVSRWWRAQEGGDGTAGTMLVRAVKSLAPSREARSPSGAGSDGPSREIAGDPCCRRAAHCAESTLGDSSRPAVPAARLTSGASPVRGALGCAPRREAETATVDPRHPTDSQSWRAVAGRTGSSTATAGGHRRGASRGRRLGVRLSASLERGSRWRHCDGVAAGAHHSVLWAGAGGRHPLVCGEAREGRLVTADPLDEPPVAVFQALKRFCCRSHEPQCKERGADAQ